MKETFEKCFLVNIYAIWEVFERNEITVMLTDKERQLSDILTKPGAPPNAILQILNTSKVIEL